MKRYLGFLSALYLALAGGFSALGFTGHPYEFYVVPIWFFCFLMTEAAVLARDKKAKIDAKARERELARRDKEREARKPQVTGHREVVKVIGHREVVKVIGHREVVVMPGSLNPKDPVPEGYPVQALYDLSVEVRKLEGKLNAGLATPDQARMLYKRLLEQYKKTHELPNHRCGGKFYQDFTYCPVHSQLMFRLKTGTHPVWLLHGDLSMEYITPLQKQEELPPMAVAPLSSAGGLIPFETEPEPDEDDSGLVPTLEESLDGYVPEGSDVLRSELKLYLSRQSYEARKTALSAGHEREWRVSPQWAAELRTLKGKEGDPLWKGPGKFLYGYPVAVGEQYGAPELTAL